jgi:hypothetical protein
VVAEASLLYSRAVSHSRVPHALTALLLLCVVSGCATTGGLFLPPRPTPPADPARAAGLEQFVDASERLRAHAAFYDHEVRKNHTKMRLMGVFSVLGAGGAAAFTASAFHPALPSDIRPGITASSISLSVLSAVFVLLPHAHQYILKEAGYRRQAADSHRAMEDLNRACGLGRLIDPNTPLSEVDTCTAGVRAAIARVRVFPDDSPCNPPPDRDLLHMLDRARSETGR